ncbi:uncharacterized protein B0H18DRAFT_988459, partial [Fomitopsis serialis]|uniref:uncharacterized protein n=1 Tax=Fomitopsis serialis TaxID=139415 RepID=UPI0020076FC9
HVKVAAMALFTHTVTFTNDCGYGTVPQSMGPNGTLLSTGQPVTFDASGFIQLLQTGNCGSNGEGCTIRPTGFGFYNGCDGVGVDCTSAECQPVPGQKSLSACCDADNVDLAITFCD